MKYKDVIISHYSLGNLYKLIVHNFKKINIDINKIKIED